MNVPRSDAPLIKHLANTYGRETALAWQRLPLIELPRTTIHDVDRMTRAVAERFDGTIRLPFDDFVLDLWEYNWGSSDREPTLHVWLRIVRTRDYLARVEVMSPWSPLIGKDLREALSTGTVETFFGQIRESAVVIESFTAIPWATPTEQLFDGPLSYALNFVGKAYRTVPASRASIELGALSMSGAKGALRAQKTVTETIDADVKIGVSIGLYLTICPDYLVEETPEAPGTRAARRRAERQPWSNPSLPRIILLDPSEPLVARRRIPLGGTHASPRPHQRRGHWAVLRDPRFHRNPDGTVRRVFVKPAWVGPREWVVEGNRYRVVDQIPTQEHWSTFEQESQRSIG